MRKYSKSLALIKLPLDFLRFARKIVCMNKSLTFKQKQVLTKIIDLTQKLGHEPTLEQVRSELNYKNTSSVQRHTDSLKKLGYLSKSRTLSLSDNDQTVQVPLVGNIACGTPFLAIENIEAYIPYNLSNLKGSDDDYFFLRGNGDSMNNTNINGKQVNDGDFVLIKKQSIANRNDRVVALVGDNATLKKLDFDNDFPVLKPESTNPINKKIIIVDDLLIQGVAIDVIKKG